MPTEPTAARPWVGPLVGWWSDQSTYTGDTKTIHPMPAAATTAIAPMRPQRYAAASDRIRHTATLAPTARSTSTATRASAIGANLTGLGVDDPDANVYENYGCASVRAGDQPQDRQGARSHDPAVAPAAGGSGDRVSRAGKPTRSQGNRLPAVTLTHADEGSGPFHYDRWISEGWRLAVYE